MTSVVPLESLQSSLAYRFRNSNLLEEALTHKSCVNERKSAAFSHNERLEFLGDSVLSLLISERLTHLLPNAQEGTLAKLKARLISEKVLSEIARSLSLGRFLRLGRGEERSKGRDKDSLLADALEAVIAAVYLDGGLNHARRLVESLFDQEFSLVATQRHRPGADDYKTQFQEWCQKRYDGLPQYAIVGESGPDHDKRFDVELTVQGKIVGRGSGRTKKEAEQSAAQEALKQSGR